MNNYVYCHFRLDNNQLFYVGKGSGNRLNSKTKRNPYWKNIVDKCNGFKSIILANNLTKKEALLFERKIIQAIKQQHGNILTNMTDGGDGGLNPSPETRKKQSEAKLGKKLTEETKQKIRLSLLGNKRSKGFKQSFETIQKRRNTVIGSKRSKEACENISKAKKAKNFKHSLETRLKISMTKKSKKDNSNGDLFTMCK